MASRRIVGFAVGQHHDAALATTALRMAVTVQGGMPAVAGVVFHSDQGNEHRGCLPSRLRPAWGHPVHGPGRVRARQRGHRELALHRGVRAPHARALHHQGPGPQPDRGMDRGVQPRPPALLDRDDLPRRVRTSSQPRRPPLLKPRLGRSPRHDHRPASRSVEHGRVLVGIKATPFGWPTASLDPDFGHDPVARSESRHMVYEPKSWSSRLQGMAGHRCCWSSRRRCRRAQRESRRASLVSSFAGNPIPCSNHRIGGRARVFRPWVAHGRHPGSTQPGCDSDRAGGSLRSRDTQ